MDKPNVNNSIDSTQALSLAEPLTPIADLGVLCLLAKQGFMKQVQIFLVLSTNVITSPLH
jgi:hypothetical protein